ncbi:MAG: hypothetical protein AAFX99_19490 [Myxococcota bacterium]
MSIQIEVVERMNHKGLDLGYGRSLAMVLCVVTMLWGCQDDTDQRLVESNDAVLPLDVTRVVYLNRKGGIYTQSKDDDSAQNTVSILDVAGPVELPPFDGTQDAWDATVACVREQYAAYNIQFVEEEPDALHMEIAVGGDRKDLGYLNNIQGVAPQRVDCKPLENGIGFVFSSSAQINNDPELACWAVAHELGHVLGLEHSLHCDENMSYRSVCTHKHFLDRDLKCGDYTAGPCLCGGETQNSHQHLLSYLGESKSVWSSHVKP